MNSSSHTLRQCLMKKGDFNLVNDWCLSEGWNLGLHDSAAYYHTDPEGHFLFLENNHPVGAISLVKHSNTFFTIGPFIVRKDLQNQHYGTTIWHRALQRLDAYPNAQVMLYAVPLQCPRYHALGFKPTFDIQRWSLSVSPKQPSSSMSTPTLMTSEQTTKLIQYDKEIFSASREKALRHLFTYPGVTPYLIEETSGTRGIGVIRPCHQGFRIGPLTADSLEEANRLIKRLIQTVSRGPILMDLPGGNDQRSKMMSDLGFVRNPHCDTLAMVKESLPPSFERHLHRQYAVFSLEIG